MLAIRFRTASVVATLAILAAMPLLVHAQSDSVNQLRSTIKAEIMADPRSKNLTQAQIYSLVNALTVQAQEQGLTPTQLTYRPTTTASGAATEFSWCSSFSCSFSDAFGLDGSIPVIPIALFVLAALFILIYGIMREMGHPHAKF